MTFPAVPRDRTPAPRRRPCPPRPEGHAAHRKNIPRPKPAPDHRPASRMALAPQRGTGWSLASGSTSDPAGHRWRRVSAPRPAGAAEATPPAPPDTQARPGAWTFGPSLHLAVLRPEEPVPLPSAPRAHLRGLPLAPFHRAVAGTSEREVEAATFVGLEAPEGALLDGPELSLRRGIARLLPLARRFGRPALARLPPGARRRHPVLPGGWLPPRLLAKTPREAATPSATALHPGRNPVSAPWIQGFQPRVGTPPGRGAVRTLALAAPLLGFCLFRV